MLEDISIEELMDRQKNGSISIIDVRSPSEFEEATIPGSLNIPLFNDEERAEIGTLYKQVSEDAAKERGLEIVSAKLPAFIKEFANIPGKKTVFCWRGGMRSRTTATLLSLMNIHAFRLAGGYRAYRQWVVSSLEDYVFHPQTIVLHGNTGTGKTAILRLLKEKGVPVIDLERMAGHRGSVFGQIGLKANNQKKFDSLLMSDLMEYENSPYVLIEAESKRIGKIVIPDFLKKKESGTHLRIDLPVEARVKIIMEDYEPWAHAERCLEAFQIIKPRIHTPVAQEIENCLKQGRNGFERAIELLLLYYYDPRYAHTESQYSGSFTTIKADTVEEAAAEIERYLSQLVMA